MCLHACRGVPIRSLLARSLSVRCPSRGLANMQAIQLLRIAWAQFLLALFSAVVACRGASRREIACRPLLVRAQAIAKRTLPRTPTQHSRGRSWPYGSRPFNPTAGRETAAPTRRPRVSPPRRCKTWSACVKYTDRWAERPADGGAGVAKWGDKWEERFKGGAGGKQGETWSGGPSGERYHRWWGETHFGDGYVQRFGHSTEGEAEGRRGRCLGLRVRLGNVWAQHRG